MYNNTMIIAQTFIQTIWATILLLGWIKVAIIVLIIAVLSRAQPLLGFLSAIIFIAYLAHWIN
ncbi:MAG: hypothetical protein KGI58_02560 [Patescibacteria group bacterium]|nr:hypothetical protein [Patescibacteria group bacterium]